MTSNHTYIQSHKLCIEDLSCSQLSATTMSWRRNCLLLPPSTLLQLKLKHRARRHVVVGQRIRILEENVLMLQLLLPLGHPHLLHDLRLQGTHSVRQWHRHAQHLSIQLPFRLVLNDRNNNCEGDWAPILGEEHVLRNKRVFGPGSLARWLLLPPLLLHAWWDVGRRHAGPGMTHWNHWRKSGRPGGHGWHWGEHWDHRPHRHHHWGLWHH